MRRAHFEALRPVCPLCRTEGRPEAPLVLAAVAREAAGHVVEGIIHCGACGMEYPIVDGVPVLVPRVRQYLADNLFHVVARDDLSEPIESLLGDAAGPGTAFDSTRQHLGSYAWDHYADLDPGEPAGGPAPGAVLRCLDAVLGLADAPPVAPAIDLGCAAGRQTFALAERAGGLVLGVDVHFALLRVAARALREGVVRYPRRRIGLVYDRREFPVELPAADRVDFWACDALALPFSEGAFAAVVGLNVLDSVASPRDLLAAVEHALRPGGRGFLACPYDWSPAVTPLEAWLGGHSQRGPLRGAAEPLLRLLLTPGAHPSAVTRLRLVAEREDVPWQVRLHDRAVTQYRAHAVALERTA